MSLKKFKTFNLATELYHQCEELQLPHHLKSQLSRASSSIALNLAEGSGKRTFKDQRRFFYIAFGSAKEVSAILTLAKIDSVELLDKVDHVGACLYKLCNRKLPPS
ncbi:MAG: four helix bundle protein [Candidatus Pacebacteria bacterium]|jgi:four helix bundle protein|nr:four helix bundle protein [Candidatus Paceibacterota bacterium]